MAQFVPIPSPVTLPHSSITTDFTVNSSLAGDGLWEGPLSEMQGEFWGTSCMAVSWPFKSLKEAGGDRFPELQKCHLEACRRLVNDVTIHKGEFKKVEEYTLPPFHGTMGEAVVHQ